MGWEGIWVLDNYWMVGAGLRSIWINNCNGCVFMARKIYIEETCLCYYVLTAFFLRQCFTLCVMSMCFH